MAAIEVDSEAVRTAGLELLRTMQASGFLALVARTDGKLMLVEIGAGVITGRQHALVQAIKQLISLALDEAEALFEEIDPNDGQEVTLQ
jgi:protein-disulfide isomerase-like protein with CxxC motif